MSDAIDDAVASVEIEVRLREELAEARQLHYDAHARCVEINAELDRVTKRLAVLADALLPAQMVLDRLVEAAWSMNALWELQDDARPVLEKLRALSKEPTT